MISGEIGSMWTIWSILKHLSQDSSFLGRESKPRPPKQKAVTHTIRFHYI